MSCTQKIYLSHSAHLSSLGLVLQDMMTQPIMVCLARHGWMVGYIVKVQLSSSFQTICHTNYDIPWVAPRFLCNGPNQAGNLDRRFDLGSSCYIHCRFFYKYRPGLIHLCTSTSLYLSDLSQMEDNHHHSIVFYDPGGIQYHTLHAEQQQE